MSLRKLLHNAETTLTNAQRNLAAVNSEITERAITLVNEYPSSFNELIIARGKNSLIVKGPAHKRNTELVEVWVVAYENNKIDVNACKYIAVKNLDINQKLLVIEHIQNRIKHKTL